jgi:small subunit ribosomal protein S4
MPELNDKCKLCRRHNNKLFLKGERCNSTKCAFVKRAFAPGQHGPKGFKKLTDYGKQLLEKQAAKRLYGLREKQFSNYVAKAIKNKTNSGDMIVRLLESRLDNVIYRLGMAKSRAAARQIVSHGFVRINDKKLDIPSYQVQPKDMVSINPTKANKKLVEQIKEKIQTVETPTWLHLEKDKLQAKVLEFPKVKEADRGFDTKTVIEYYSR